jgi:dephospho-CoA kinase
MLRVGLTGGIGSGKSTVARRLGELGAVVVDADRLAREVLAVGTPGLDAVVRHFGPDVLGAEGALDRAALGAIVFADPAARAELEGITHPLVAARTAELVSRAPSEAVVVHDVPLLVEKHLGAGYHLVVVVDADVDRRIERLTSARGLTEGDARSRIAVQSSDEERRAAADVWLVNDGTVAQLEAAVDVLWKQRLVPFNDNVVHGRRAPRPEVPTLVAPDPTWPAQARRLVQRVQRALGDRAATVDHIGSTSIPGMPAKDVIDLQVGVRALADADQPDFVRAMRDQGFPRAEGNTEDTAHPWAPDPADWQKRFHGSADPGRLAHVHVRAVDGPGYEVALLFRDWLRACPPEAGDYAQAKGEAAATCVTTSDYAVAKEPWMAAAIPRARDWARRTGWSSR